jgi:hypothetical protein
MARVVLVLHGGLISDILSDSPDVEIITMDEDVEGLDEEEIVTVEGKQVFAQKRPADCARGRIDQIFSDFGKERKG